VESNHQLITVIIQYRLGLFGFLAGSAVAKNGNMNAGLLDQEFAFKWVQDHITKFGGDPGKVTIWGESAGGGSVLQHLISRDGQASPKLFRAGISSSSFLPSQYKFNDAIPEGLYKQAVSQANCAKNSDTLTCLRSADASTLANINVALNAAAFYGTYTLVPVVDEQFITQSPTQALKQGLTKGSALLSITNADEGFIFIDPNTNYTAAQYAERLFPKLTTAEAQSVGEVYDDFGSKFNQSAKIMADAIFVCPNLFLQSSFSQSNKMTWAGQFSIPPALHVQDVFYYFKSVSLYARSFQHPRSQARRSPTYVCD
jgi:carboxylesterase type B